MRLHGKSAEISEREDDLLYLQRKELRYEEGKNVLEMARCMDQGSSN